MAQAHIGLSGYSYKPWQGPGRFYPATLKQAGFLGYYATRYDTVELDGVWYRLPSEKAVADWLTSTPADFLFAPKVHRQITHRARLKPECYDFIQVMLNRLKPLASAERLGPLLIQLPPNMKRDDDRLASFLGQLPASVRWAIEFRHESWHDTSVELLLRRFNVSWVAADSDERPVECRDTAGFWYVRLRRSAYDDGDLERWAGRIREMVGEGKSCFVYCKHEDEGSPWVWADRLLQLVRE
ncbi:MAG TPA: DUF72 domain-containing protein [Nitrospira sp.]|nr:DUF72 domain-containing protein [Nitrospira sp.]